MLDNLSVGVNSKISIGVIVSVLTIVGASFAWCYSTVENALDNQDTRISVMETTVYNMAGDVHQTAGKVDIIEEQVKQINQANQTNHR